MKPIAPIIAVPIAVILSAFLYSSVVGFLVTCNTRIASLKNRFTFPCGWASITVSPVGACSSIISENRRLIYKAFFGELIDS